MRIKPLCLIFSSFKIQIKILKFENENNENQNLVLVSWFSWMTWNVMIG